MKKQQSQNVKENKQDGMGAIQTSAQTSSLFNMIDTYLAFNTQSTAEVKSGQLFNMTFQNEHMFYHITQVCFFQVPVVTYREILNERAHVIKKKEKKDATSLRKTAFGAELCTFCNLDLLACSVTAWVVAILAMF